MKSKNITKFDKKIPLTAASNVHRLAKDLGIDLNDIELSSNNSRLSIDDVKRHVKERLKNQSNQISLQNDSDRKIQIGMHSYNIDYIEQMYEKWLSSEDLEPTWQSYFEGFELGKNFEVENPGPNSADMDDKQAKFLGMVYAYRALGHTIAKFNPLISEPLHNPRLTLERLGFTDKDFNKIYNTGNYLGGIDLSVKDLIDGMERKHIVILLVSNIFIYKRPIKEDGFNRKLSPRTSSLHFQKKKNQTFIRILLRQKLLKNFYNLNSLDKKGFHWKAAKP